MEGENAHCSSEFIGDTIREIYKDVEHHHKTSNCTKDASNCAVKTTRNESKLPNSHQNEQLSYSDTKNEESKPINVLNNKESKENNLCCQKISENGIQTENSSNLKVDCFNDNIEDCSGADNKQNITAVTDSDISNLLQILTINDNNSEKKIDFVPYKNEEQLPDLVTLITQDLSEPYSVYTYRYFLHNWPHLSHLAYCGSECVGAIVCKLDVHRKSVLRGYIAMLVVHKSYRRCKIGSSLVRRAILKMIDHGCEEVVLETEVTNKAALELYENLGFVRDKRLLRYYLNGVDAWRLKLWLK